ncbi:glycoside hydrolase superfamily [Dunaliella salina]|nr:glycoside hydrolase superfamily [Dunaliella salina]|eukprot:KAF5833596.1 glycoside hydrolase superfamily [Dunaliella salina]
MAFGEYWDSCNYTDSVLDYDQDSHRLQTLNWCEATGGKASAFDFTTKGILQDALRRNERWRLADPEGRPPGTMGLWPSRAVTILDNHDTGSTQNHWPFPSKNIQEGYAYILTHPGTPCVFYDHLYSAYQSGERSLDSLRKERSSRKLRKPLHDLIALRSKHGIHARSSVKILQATGDLYAAIVDDKVAVKLGPAEWEPQAQGIQLGRGKQPKLAVSGFQFSVWEAADA